MAGLPMLPYVCILLLLPCSCHGQTTYGWVSQPWGANSCPGVECAEGETSAATDAACKGSDGQLADVALCTAPQPAACVAIAGSEQDQAPEESAGLRTPETRTLFGITAPEITAMETHDGFTYTLGEPGLMKPLHDATFIGSGLEPVPWMTAYATGRKLRTHPDASI